MITRKDCIILLNELSLETDTTSAMNELLNSNEPTLNVLKFINDNRQFQVTAFYEKLRKSYNNKKSKLYIEIVKDEMNTSKDVVVTLSSLCLQILLYSKTLENATMFLRTVRFREICACLYNYSTNYDIVPCQKLLSLIKADVKIMEYIQKDM